LLHDVTRKSATSGTIRFCLLPRPSCLVSAFDRLERLERFERLGTNGFLADSRLLSLAMQ
jgi:hypothetical protein